MKIAAFFMVYFGMGLYTFQAVPENGQASQNRKAGCQKKPSVSRPFPDIAQGDGTQKGPAIYGPGEDTCQLAPDMGRPAPDDERIKTGKQQSMAASGHGTGEKQDSCAIQKEEQYQSEAGDGKCIGNDTDLSHAVCQSPSGQPRGNGGKGIGQIVDGNK